MVHMRTSRRARPLSLALVALASVAIGAPVAIAHAQGTAATPSAERLKSAAEEYDRGRRAYLANDFEQAAIHFENAYNDAPRAEPLRNAIRARTQAKQLARAATLSALAQALYANDTATMELATATLNEAKTKLHEVHVACTPECGIAADGRVVSLTDAKAFVVFLDPGAHELAVSWPGDRSKNAHVDAKPGGHDELTLEAPAAPVTPPPTATATPTATPTATTSTTAVAPGNETPPSRKPLGRVPFYIGAGLTVVGVGATIASGIDAQNNPGTDAVKRDCVGQGESCPTYRKGVDAQTRTNVILAATGGVALVTAVIGVFFTQWTDVPPEKKSAFRALDLVDVKAGPQGATLGISGDF
jgi:hypothetical protein